ncbi:MAG TPA: hypothetical protein VEU06_04700 [Micropepsaceae bacterium]|nr:hypothetical protein [Micropepsaceae bacterium]
MNMKRMALAIFATVLLAGCGTTQGDRGLSGAGIGAGIGILGGPPGIVIGAAAGAATGMLTRPQQINLGRPVWRA